MAFTLTLVIVLKMSVLPWEQLLSHVFFKLWRPHIQDLWQYFPKQQKVQMGIRMLPQHVFQDNIIMPYQQGQFCIKGSFTQPLRLCLPLKGASLSTLVVVFQLNGTSSLMHKSFLAWDRGVGDGTGRPSKNGTSARFCCDVRKRTEGRKRSAVWAGDAGAVPWQRGAVRVGAGRGNSSRPRARAAPLHHRTWLRWLILQVPSGWLSGQIPLALALWAFAVFSKTSSGCFGSLLQDGSKRPKHLLVWFFFLYWRSSNAACYCHVCPRRKTSSLFMTVGQCGAGTFGNKLRAQLQVPTTTSFTALLG